MATLRKVAVTTSLFLALGCGAEAAPPAPEPPSAPVPTPPPAAPPPEVPRPADVHANELGQVPVLMYHRFVPDPDSVYERTADDFRAELERLADEDYVPVTTAQLTKGEFDIPAGKHPVVLTFDDGDPSVLTLGPDGEPLPGSAVRILLDVAAAHPGFTPVASFYVNADPFGGGDAGGRALHWMHRHGFEIGNHTLGHTNLRSAAAETAREDIARGDAMIRETVPGYEPVSIALPFGAHPRESGLELKGPGYEYDAALLVGANPAPSPYSAKFDSGAVPRIRSQAGDGDEAEYGSTVWLDRLEAEPETRYTSDGAPDVISYPSGRGSPAPPFAAAARPY